MTVVNIATGEVVDLDAPAAERRAERITLRLDAIADNYRAVLPMIREAIEKRDDLALGYRSPGDYVSDRFGQALAGLGIEVRRAVVGELTAAGLSTRAIAPVVGVDNATVHRDLARVADATPQAPEPDVAPDTVPTEARTPRSAGAVDTPPVPVAVTGIDGKTYPKPQAVKARDDAETYLNQIESLAAKAARESKNLTAEQIRRVKPKADLWTVGLRNSIETLQRLVDSLDNQEIQ